MADRLEKLSTMDDSGELECMHISSINKINDLCFLNVSIENNPVQMEIESGSSVTIVSI